jgi:CRISPR-associated endonuclease/helicase Cas3
LDSAASGTSTFAADFAALTGHPPFRWQERLFARFVAGDLPPAIDLPTGLGKTSVMAIWLLARAVNPRLPRRLVYVVDRRVVVDQATTETQKLRDALAKPDLARLAAALGLGGKIELPISTLRGQFADNREWLADPSRPAIVVGTIDMIGSRLLFEGYGVSPGMRPYQAGLLGADTLLVLDEAHLAPPFAALLAAIAGDDTLKPRGAVRRAVVPGFQLLALSATGRGSEGDSFRLEPEDHDPSTQPMVHQRYTAGKRLALHDLEPDADLAKALAERAWALGEGGRRVLIFCDAFETARKVEATLRKRITGTTGVELEVLVGKRRVRERQGLVVRLTELGFIHPAKGERPACDAPAFLVATSAGEVGIDVDADDIVCDLVAYERMVQRLGRVNRRGGEGRTAAVDVFHQLPKPPDLDKQKDESKREKAKAEYEAKTAIVRGRRDVLRLLPIGGDGRHDASAQAFAEFKAAHAEAIEPATTPAPLRPALDRAVVDAWSLTSLAEHPGRPEPDPWLRGWIDDDEPQAQVIWRRWLPWRAGSDRPNTPEVEDFFAAARPHASEMLEAPVRRVRETLIARAAAVLAQRKAVADDEAGGAPSTTRTADGIIVLSRARAFKGARTLAELAALAGTGKLDVEDLDRLLTNGIIVASASLGGINLQGLLDDDVGGPDEAGGPGCLDAGWDAEDTGIRLSLAGPKPRLEGDWREAYRFALGDGEDDEPDGLLVEVLRGKDAPRAGDFAVGRWAQSLDEHGTWAKEEAGRLADALGISPGHRAMLVAAAGAHDLGKARDLWQNAMAGREKRAGRPYAKSTRAGDPARLKIGPHTYRHEFGSLKDVEADPALLADVPEDLVDLALHLIAAHHGHARPLIAPVDPLATPAESRARAAAAALRFARLQRDWGPWVLAWWEAVLRAADWAASARNDAQAKGERAPAETPPAGPRAPAEEEPA